MQSKFKPDIRRWAMRVGVIICLVVVVVASILWIRSLRHFDYARWTSSRNYLVTTSPHGINFSTWMNPQDQHGLTFASYEYFVHNVQGAWVTPRPANWSKLGFDFQPLQFSNATVPQRKAFELCIPFWFVIFVAAIPPGLSFAAWSRTRKRHTAGQCTQCGYDLRASTGRCPECGLTHADMAIN